MGQNYYNQRLYQQAKLLYQQALSAFEGIKGNFRTSQTQEGEATARLWLGNAYHFLGQFSNAMNLHQRTLEITRQLRDRPGEAEALLGLGNVYYSLGNYKKPDDKNALKFYQDALSIFQELGATQGEARVKLGLGKTYHSLGKCQEAIKYLGEGGS
ncbi:MAG: tetratricopeptide repeat protein [Microcoleus sp. SU_5_3]|nr:tetratricopeptide repeat protein [Microcoleus sp. SU_5_3]